MTSAGGDAGSPEDVPPRTPGPAGATGLIFVVLALFLVGGVPLQLAFGEAGLIFAQLLLLFLPAVLFVRWGRYDAVRTLSLRLPSPLQLRGGLLVLVGGIQLAWVITWLQSFVIELPVEYLEAMSAALTADSPGRFLWLLLLAAVVPAIAEETFFRGAVLSGFRKALPDAAAVVVAGLVFGLFHLTPETAFRFLPTAWLGILLGWVVVSSGSLPLGVFLHFLNNGLILSLTALPLTRDQVAGTEADPPLLLLPMGLLLLVWGLRTLGREPGVEPESERDSARLH